VERRLFDHLLRADVLVLDLVFQPGARHLEQRAIDVEASGRTLAAADHLDLEIVLAGIELIALEPFDAIPGLARERDFARLDLDRLSRRAVVDHLEAPGHRLLVIDIGRDLGILRTRIALLRDADIDAHRLRRGLGMARSGQAADVNRCAGVSGLRAALVVTALFDLRVLSGHEIGFDSHADIGGRGVFLR
jgi:hypothetical protein